MSRHSLDIFETLNAIDQRDMEFIRDLPDDKRSGFAPVVVMRWASATRGQSADWYLMAINERANIHFFDLYAHPELQYKLLASCGIGSRERHEWISSPPSKEKKRRAFVSKYWPEANDLEIDIILQDIQRNNSLDDLLKSMGLQNDEIKSIKEAFKE